jgi:hypothetical protein
MEVPPPQTLSMRASRTSAQEPRLSGSCSRVQASPGAATLVRGTRQESSALNKPTLQFGTHPARGSAALQWDHD